MPLKPGELLKIGFVSGRFAPPAPRAHAQMEYDPVVWARVERLIVNQALRKPLEE